MGKRKRLHDFQKSYEDTINCTKLEIVGLLLEIQTYKELITSAEKEIVST